MKKIPNYFHFIYGTDYFENNDIDPYVYYSIKSVIEINNPELLYFHYYILPFGKLWNKIKDKLTLKKIMLPKIYENNSNNYIKKYLKIIIYKNLTEYGGIYINLCSIAINNIEHYLDYNFVKSNNDEIICSEKNSYMANLYFQLYLNFSGINSDNDNDLFSKNIIPKTIQKKIKENKIDYSKEEYSSFINEYKYTNNTYQNIQLIDDDINKYISSEYFGKVKIHNIELNNYLINNFNYNNSNENIENILFKEIYDYSFGEYFHLLKNVNFLFFNNNENVQNINIYDIFNKVTIYNLLCRNAISHKFINTINTTTNTTTNTTINTNQLYKECKYDIINNIDYIYWINLEESYERRENMIQLLKNFKIDNIRINAINGSIEKNINEKYFYSEYGKYPIYNNKEYAILLSHLNTIEKYTNIDKSELKYRVSLICEDDLSLDFLNYWNKDLKTIIEEAPLDWDIIMLGYFSVNLQFNTEYKKWDNEWSAISYLINHNAKTKINNLKKENKWICKESDLMVSDNYIFSKLNTYVYKYPYFTFPNDNDSTFHEDHLNYHKIYKISNYITLENIYDDFLLEKE